MADCTHTKLTYLVERPQDRARCRVCHLTITTAELGNGHCPECYEVSGTKRFDFETVADEPTGPQQLRCEDCGTIIEVADEVTP